MSGDDYADTFEEQVNKPVDERNIPADTMKVIREGVEDKKRWASAFRDVLTVLKRLGFLTGHISELLEKYPNGLAKKFCHDYGADFNTRLLRAEVERVYNEIGFPFSTEELARTPFRPVEWLVEVFFPANTVTGFFGDGGTGKDRTLMLLAAAVACDRERWLGKKVKHGRALYYNVEDD